MRPTPHDPNPQLQPHHHNQEKDSDMTKLLSVSADPKTTKGGKLGFLTGVCYMTPHKSPYDRANLCPWATPLCSMACLSFAGRGRDERKSSPIKIARDRRRSLWVAEDRTFFWALLAAEVEALTKKAKRLKMTTCIRLNGTSDILWERYTEFHELCTRYATVQFYDYTKCPVRHRLGRPANYHLTFSWSGGNDTECREALKLGVNVAVPYLTALPLSDKFGAYGEAVPVVNGDESDLRFLDPPGVIVGLKNKPVSAKRLRLLGCGQFVKPIGGGRHGLPMA